MQSLIHFNMILYHDALFNNFPLKIQNHKMLSSEQIDYLKKCKVTENDPALLFDWNYNELEKFVAIANENQSNTPYFISSAPGKMTVNSLVEDMMNLMSTVSGGRNGNNLLAPNNLSQLSNIVMRLKDIEMNSWVQQLFDQDIPVGSVFATIFYISNKRTMHAIEISFRAPRESRQVFR